MHIQIYIYVYIYIHTPSPTTWVQDLYIRVRTGMRMFSYVCTYMCMHISYKWFFWSSLPTTLHTNCILGTGPVYTCTYMYVSVFICMYIYVYVYRENIIFLIIGAHHSYVYICVCVSRKQHFFDNHPCPPLSAPAAPLVQDLCVYAHIFKCTYIYAFTYMFMHISMCFSFDHPCSTILSTGCKLGAGAVRTERMRTECTMKNESWTVNNKQRENV